MFHYPGLPYVPKIIRSELISRHHNELLIGHFGIKKTQELIAREYYWPMLWQDVEAWVKGCNICLASNAVCYTPYKNLLLLPIPTHWWKNLSIDLVIGLPILANWKGDSYNSILVIVDWLTKMIYYEPVKITINTAGLAKVIIDMVVYHYEIPMSIMIDQGSLFTSKFWSLLCYSVRIKRKLSTVFHSQNDSQTERQNSTMKAYLRTFINGE